MRSRFLGVSPQPGKVVSERRTIGALPDGTPLSIPIILICGRADGPTVYLQAGIHGNEVTGIQALVTLLQQINVDSVHGLIVATPVANPGAFLTRSRGFSLEERGPVDINRIFPGSASGTLSEQVAYVIAEQFVRQADVSISFHSALFGCNIHPFAYIDPDDDHSGTLQVRLKLSRAFGFDLAYFKKGGTKLGTSDMSGSLSAWADRESIPVFTVEFGESDRVTWAYIPKAVAGALNALRVLGSLNETPMETQESQRFTSLTLVHAQCGGLLRPLVNLGDVTTEGAVIAEVVDILSREAQPVISPGTGHVLRMMTLSSVMPGAELFWLAS